MRGNTIRLMAGLILILMALSGCQISLGTDGALRLGLMQPLHESENTQTTQVTLFGLEIAAASEGNGSPAVRLGYVRTQITSIPAYIPTRDADGIDYTEPTVSINTDASKNGIRETLGVGRWGKNSTTGGGEQKPLNSDAPGESPAANTKAPSLTAPGRFYSEKPLGIEH